jgi:hypothetical protein
MYVVMYVVYGHCKGEPIRPTTPVLCGPPRARTGRHPARRGDGGGGHMLRRHKHTLPGAEYGWYRYRSGVQVQEESTVGSKPVSTVSSSDYIHRRLHVQAVARKEGRHPARREPGRADGQRVRHSIIITPTDYNSVQALNEPDLFYRPVRPTSRAQAGMPLDVGALAGLDLKVLRSDMASRLQGCHPGAFTHANLSWGP